MDFVREHRIAEIGRFAVVPAHRGHILVVAALMRAVTQDTVSRGFTHYVTDVFEDDAHSPFGFHTRALGFSGGRDARRRRTALPQPAHHAGARPACRYKRLKRQGNWLYRYFTLGWGDALHQRLAA